MLKELFGIYLVVCSSYCTTNIICYGIAKVERYINKRKTVEAKVEIGDNEKVYEMINEYHDESNKSSDEYKEKCKEFEKTVESFINQCQENKAILKDLDIIGEEDKRIREEDRKLRDSLKEKEGAK